MRSRRGSIGARYALARRIFFAAMPIVRNGREAGARSAASAITYSSTIFAAMKRCNKCGIEKPEHEFYKHPNTADGLLGKCKACKRDEVKSQQAIYRQTEACRQKSRERNRSDSRKFAHLRPAHHALRNALRRGEIEKPSACWYCGSTDRVQGHHADYSRPLDVVWLCDKCHKRVHRETRAYLEQEKK